MQVSSAGLSNHSSFQAWLLKLDNFCDAFIQYKCLFIIYYKRCILVVFIKKKERTIINIKMTLHSFAYSVWCSSLYQSLYYPVRSQTGALVQRLCCSSSGNSCLVVVLVFLLDLFFLDSVEGRAAGSPSIHLALTPVQAWGKKHQISEIQCLPENVPCRVQGKGRGGFFPIFFKSSMLASSTVTSLSVKRSWISKSWDWRCWFVCL